MLKKKRREKGHNMEPELTLTIETIPEDISKCKPFPVVYVLFDLKSLEIIYQTTIYDKMQREGWSLKVIKGRLSNVFKVNAWLEERDITLRAFNLYGIFNFGRKRQQPGILGTLASYWNRD